MKKLLLLTAMIFISCTSESSHVVNENSNNRIKIKEERVISGHLFMIIKVDSSEFITSSYGGFYKL